MRNPTIELFRYVFAFLVVLIHVQLAHGGTFFMPLARCAVPFFYLVSGYFLAKKMRGGDEHLCLRSAKKWIRMWGRYIVVFAVLGLLIDWYCGTMSYPSMKDAVYMITQGVCPYIDEHIVDSHKLGIMTLWFLYDGALAFALLYVLRRHLFSKVLLFAVVVLQLVSAVAVHEHWGGWWNFLYASVPYIYYGMWIGKSGIFETTMEKQRPYVLLLAIASVLYICGMVEYKMMGDEVFVNIPLSILLFLLIHSDRTAKALYKFTPPPAAQPITASKFLHVGHLHLAQIRLCLDGHGGDGLLRM